MKGRNNNGSIIIIIVAAICLLPFLRLAFYAHPYLDDFIFPINIRYRGLLTQSIGIYLTWSGKFSATFIAALHPLTWGSIHHIQPFIFGFILAFSGCVLFMGNAIFYGHSTPLHIRLAPGSLLLILLLLMLPSPNEAFYWLICALGYSGGSACCFLLLGVIFILQAETNYIKRCIWWTIATGLTAIAPGFSEIICCFALSSAIILAPRLWNRQLGKGWIILLIVAMAAAIVVMLAPGNFIRRGTNQPTLLTHSVLLSIVSVTYTIISWLGNGLIILFTLLAIPTIQQLVSIPTLPLHRLTKQVWIWPVWLILGLLLCYTFSYLAINAPPPSRARNILFALFLIGWFMSVTSILSWRVRNNFFALSLPNYIRVSLACLIVLFVLSDHNFKLQHNQVGTPTNSVALAYRDWLSGDAAQYDKEEQIRYAIIEHSQKDKIELPALSTQPKTLVWYDISTNPDAWGNKVYANFFHKKSIWVRP